MVRMVNQSLSLQADPVSTAACRVLLQDNHTISGIM